MSEPLKETLGFVRKADTDFGLIERGDRIAVGLSGGKDSLVLLQALHLYRLFSHKDYTLCAILVHPGYDFDPSPLVAHAQSLGVPLYIHPGNVVETANALAKPGKSPCPLCAKMRRGALNATAVAHGCNKVALGHHRNDALETFCMSMLFESRLNTLSPKTHLDRTGLTVIRPLLYAREGHIAHLAQRLGLPVQKPVCPFDGHTMRQTIKQQLHALSQQFPHAEERMFLALQHTDLYNLWDRYRVPDLPPSHGHERND